ncbi:MAG: PaaI family thioesterase [Candidatus Omnitrophica bacterium]|nr:PaaI family thioesterase [Candidatus Omnitrophota bacterium]
MPIKHIDYCFVCGKNNPLGLHAVVERDKDKIIGEFVPKREHEGPKGILHGGIVSALLDEVMVHLAHTVISPGQDTPTVSLTIRFFKPVPTGKKIILEAIATGKHSKLVQAQASVKFEDGTLVARAEGKFIILNTELKDFKK